MPVYIGLDFETYGAVDLNVHGLDRYINDASFKPLIASVVSEKNVPDELDFVHEKHRSLRILEERTLECDFIVAHNAGFEERVLDRLGLSVPSNKFVDSAVVARAAGAASRLEAAAPQLLNADKMAEGQHLIKLFSTPGKYQEKYDTREFVDEVITEHPYEWRQFKEYCTRDAQLGLRLVMKHLATAADERDFAAITRDMAWRGWPVDIPLVEEMQRRYLENQEEALSQFLQQHDPFVGTEKQLNLNSFKQLKEWCAARGVRATSFDEKHVASLLTRLNKKLESMRVDDPKRDGYFEVRELLVTKQVLGGSSLKKLQTILDTVGEDGRLRDQYVHAGAGQTLRTSGRSVQMQNLKQIGEEPQDVTELADPSIHWNNDLLAKNLRQVFTSSHPDGRLIVGDFKSVESRGLAWLAQEDYKLDAYRQGKDLYKVLAASPEMFDVPYDQVTKEQRKAGKVGELSCGYGAGPSAVQAFADKMGIEMSEGEAAQLVSGWRAANPNITALWDQLDQLLHSVVSGSRNMDSIHLREGWTLTVLANPLPHSLLLQVGSTSPACSITMTVHDPGRSLFMKRVFHGCHLRGRNVSYYKPSSRKTGDLWSNTYTDPKTGALRFYELYGGKLTGILTQSFCRELFFRVLSQVGTWAARIPNVDLIGQFHDEIVLDWRPGPTPLETTKADLEHLMSDPGPVQGFPLEADIKSDYRYTK